MDLKTKQIFEELASKNDLRLDAASDCLHGAWGQYHLCAVPDPRNNNAVDLIFSVAKYGGPADQDELADAIKGVKLLKNCQCSDHRVEFKAVQSGFKKSAENLATAMDEAARILAERGYQDCCEACGKPVETRAYMIGSTPTRLCDACYAAVGEDLARKRLTKESKHENVIGGLVGALVGSIVGALAIVLFSRLNLVSAISGIVMAVCTLKGYELLGGKLSVKGIILSALVMLLMVYVGDRADWAIVIMNELNTDFFTGFRALPELIEIGAVESGKYWANLAMVYVFAAVGAIPTILSNLKGKKKNSNSIRVMD